MSKSLLSVSIFSVTLMALSTTTAQAAVYADGQFGQTTPEIRSIGPSSDTRECQFFAGPISLTGNEFTSPRYYVVSGLQWTHTRTITDPRDGDLDVLYSEGHQTMTFAISNVHGGSGYADTVVNELSRFSTSHGNSTLIGPEAPTNYTVQRLAVSHFTLTSHSVPRGLPRWTIDADISFSSPGVPGPTCHFHSDFTHAIL